MRPAADTLVPIFSTLWSYMIGVGALIRTLSGTSVTPGKANVIRNMWYFRMLESYPLQTKMASAFFIFGSADLTSQIYEKMETHGASLQV